MKKNLSKKSWGALALLCLLAFVLVLCLRQTLPRSDNQTHFDQQAAHKVQPVGISSNADVQKTGTNGLPTRVGPVKTQLSREETLRLGVDAENVPINFWGKVVDQDGNPLAGVKITATARMTSLSGISGIMTSFSTVNVVSDAAGKFEIHDLRGDVLTVKAVEKNGYEPDPEALRGFGYNLSQNISPNPDEPVTLRMWKTGIKEPLITGEKSFHIVPDGRSYIIDLSSGAIAESGNGDLKVWIKYAQQVVQGQKYSWSCEIEAINGGLLEETNGYSSMFLAPNDGYTPTFKLDQEINGGQHGSIGRRRFYVNNGQHFGRILIELVAPYNGSIPGLIRIDYAINPTGSRILR